MNRSEYNLAASELEAIKKQEANKEGNRFEGISEYNLAASELEAIRKEEKDFNNWYSNIAEKHGYSASPNDPLHFYDYKAAYREGVRNPDKDGHWPSKYKHDLHPNRFIPKGGKNEGWWDTKYEKDANMQDIMIWKDRRTNLLDQVEHWEARGEPNV